MGAFVLSDGSVVVSLYPEWDFERDNQKMEDVHRSRSGRMYRYKWGEFQRVKFGIEHLSSSDMTKINSWWGANTALRLFDTGSTVVISGYLTNKGLPIGEYMEPYDNEFGGTIELESY